MTRILWLAIGVTTLLGGILIYVAEDIPRFGDPESPAIHAVKVFDIPLDGLEGLLDEDNIRRLLTEMLRQRSLPLPVRIERIEGASAAWNAFVSKEEMFYPREEKYYLIEKHSDRISVKRYAFVVRWIEKGENETGVPNMVTYGLADYRGYDTLGETTVIFTAGVSVILLLRRRSRL